MSDIVPQQATAEPVGLVSPDVVTPELLDAIRQNRHGIADLLSQFTSRDSLAPKEDWRDSLILGLIETFQNHLNTKGPIRRSTVNAAVRFYESQYRIRRNSAGGAPLVASLTLFSPTGDLSFEDKKKITDYFNEAYSGPRWLFSDIIQWFRRWRRK